MKSKRLKAVHETAQDLLNAGAISATTMRKFDVLCLPTVHGFTPQGIKKLRAAINVSQAVFAAYLNTSVSTVKQWEIGEKKPSGMALRLLNLIEKKGIGVLFDEDSTQHC